MPNNDTRARRFNNHKPAVGAYKSCLRPPTSICDVTYWLNFLADQRNHDSSGNRSMDENKGHGRRIAAINTAGKNPFCSTHTVHQQHFSNYFILYQNSWSIHSQWKILQTPTTRYIPPGQHIQRRYPRCIGRREWRRNDAYTLHDILHGRFACFAHELYTERSFVLYLAGEWLLLWMWAFNLFLSWQFSTLPWLFSAFIWD